MSSAACGAGYKLHCVLAAGFHNAAPILYCIVKYPLFLDMSENTCGVADDATVPEVTLDMSEDEATSTRDLQPLVQCLYCPRSSGKFDFSGKRLHELFLYSAPCMARQWMHVLTSVHGGFAEFHFSRLLYSLGDDFRTISSRIRQSPVL